MFYLIFILLTILFFMLATMYVHEYGHALVAKMLGWKVHGMLYRWYGAGMKVEFKSEDAKDLWLVAVGGLLATLALMSVGLWLSLIFPVFFILAGINFFVFITNILPIKGLDGYYIALAAIRYFRRPSGTRSET